MDAPFEPMRFGDCWHVVHSGTDVKATSPVTGVSLCGLWGYETRQEAERRAAAINGDAALRMSIPRPPGGRP